MISEEMYEVMMHMIGYASLDTVFIDAAHSCDHELLLALTDGDVGLSISNNLRKTWR